MAKAKPGQNKNVQNAKQQLHAIKNGSVKKDKNPKFKNTPVGKVALINNSKAQNKNAPPQTNFQKGVKNNAKKSKQNPAKNKQNSSNRAQNKSAIKEIILTTENELEEIDDSDSDIDEETTLDDVSMTKLDETLEDEEGSDSDIPNILGKSLEDESDEDDEDFEEEEEEEEDDDNDIEEEMIEHKNIKTLKGVKPKAKKNEKTESDKNKELREVTMEDDDDEDDEDDDDEEDEEDEKEDENADLHKDILGKNLEDESDEDDDLEDEEEEDDDDDDDDGNDDDIGTVEHKGIKMFKGVKSKVENNDEDENEEDEDEDEDEDDNDDNEDSALGLKALLGNSIIDEEDDEDFDEDDEDEDDEDDDISDEDEDGEENDNVTKVTKEKAAKASSNKDIPKGQKQVKEGEKKLSPEEQAEIDKRTIFINNIPKETKEAEIRKVFSKFGPINNLRFRNIIPQDSKMSKKVAAITKQIHPKVTTVVVYINYKSKESAQKALSMNGKIFEGNYIHVQTVGKLAKKEWDSKKAVFIGNLKFGIDNNTIWKHFSTCGEIESVHLIRDKKTGETKGFGYVNFKTEDSAVLALKLDGVEIMKRPVRVKPYISGDNKKGQKRVSTDNNDSNPRKKFKNNLEKPVACKVENEAKIKKHKKLQKNNAKPEEQKLISFQGQKADSKNKKKENKLDKKKKKMAKQLTAKSNKPVKV